MAILCQFSTGDPPFIIASSAEAPFGNFPVFPTCKQSFHCQRGLFTYCQALTTGGAKNVESHCHLLEMKGVPGKQHFAPKPLQKGTKIVSNVQNPQQKPVWRYRTTLHGLNSPIDMLLAWLLHQQLALAQRPPYLPQRLHEALRPSSLHQGISHQQALKRSSKDAL